MGRRTSRFSEHGGGGVSHWKPTQALAHPQHGPCMGCRWAGNLVLLCPQRGHGATFGSCPTAPPMGSGWGPGSPHRQGIFAF